MSNTFIMAVKNLSDTWEAEAIQSFVIRFKIKMMSSILKTGVVLLLAIMAGCYQYQEQEPMPIENITETPEVLEESSGYLSSISSVKKRRPDIILKLYQEALENDPELNNLQDQINDIEIANRDSLRNMRRFLQTNSNFWQGADRYINNISDSTLRRSTYDLFNSLEDRLNRNLANHKDELSEIDKLETTLDDQSILLKLFVAESMMDNYRQNEMPDIETLKNMVKTYEDLIKSIEEQTPQVQ